MTKVLRPSDFKPKDSSRETLFEQVGVPTWLTHSSAFPSSILSGILNIPAGSSYAYYMRPADPLAPSTAAIHREVADLVHGWLADHISETPVDDPTDYLFEPSIPESVPAEWVNELFSTPVAEHTDFVMDEDSE